MKVVTVVRIIMQPLNTKNLATSHFFLHFLSTFGKSKLTQSTTNVMLSGQRFAILAMFFFGGKKEIFVCGKVA